MNPYRDLPLVDLVARLREQPPEFDLLLDELVRRHCVALWNERQARRAAAVRAAQLEGVDALLDALGPPPGVGRAARVYDLDEARGRE